jgi:hypothetical protein
MHDTALMIEKLFFQLYWKSGDFSRPCVECVPRRREMTIEPERARMHIAMIVNRVISDRGTPLAGRHSQVNHRIA